MPPPSEHVPSMPGRPLVVIFLVVLCLALWLMARGWHDSLLDRHPYRQTQTALVTYWIKQTGFKLAYEMPVFGPPWSAPMEFPTYQLVVAKLSGWLGTGLESTGRGVSVAFLLGSLPAVYALAGLLGLTPSRRLLVVATVLAGPVFLFWGRTFLIETTAMCGAIWFLYALARVTRDGGFLWTGCAALIGSFAALTKVTTFFIHLGPAAIVTVWLLRAHWREHHDRLRLARRLALVATPVLLAGAVGYWWVSYSDHLKGSNPLSQFLTSRSLTSFTWGTLDQRLSLNFWQEVWTSVSGLVVSEIGLALLLVSLALVGGRPRRIALWGAGFFLTGLLLFSNLFYFHDYYYCANAVFLLGGAGVLLAAVWDDSRLPLAVRALVLGLFFGGQFLGYHRNYAHYAAHDLPPIPEIAQVMYDSVPPEGVVVVYGLDWNTSLAYYSQRRTVMVTDWQVNNIAALEEVLARLPPLKIAGLLIASPTLAHSSDFVQERLRRFGLSPTPLASGEEGDFYVPQPAMLPAAQKLQGHPFKTLKLNRTANADTSDFAGLTETPVDTLALPFLSPHPIRAQSTYGMSPVEIVGRPAVNAHPLSELTFHPPGGETHVVIEFGLNPEAYAPGADSVTDGVTFEILDGEPGTFRRLLYHRHLDPVRNADDRGPQMVDLPEVGSFSNPVVFRTSPGPAGNAVRDWAYWSRIEFK